MMSGPVTKRIWRLSRCRSNALRVCRTPHGRLFLTTMETRDDSGPQEECSMAYRLHIQAYDGSGKRLSNERLRRELLGLVASGGVGHVGTRQGAPGIWIERESKVGIRAAAWTVSRFAQNTGYVFRYFATNAPSVTAVADLVRVERG